MRMTRGVLPTPESVAVPGTDPVYSSIADLRTMGEAICAGHEQYRPGPRRHGADRPR